MAKHGPKLVTGSVVQLVRDEVSSDVSMQDALARDYANLSALARTLRPGIERRLGRKVSEQGVMTSLKRLRKEFGPAGGEFSEVIGGSVVNMRTHVSKLSVEKSRRSLKIVGTLLTEHQEAFIQVSESVSSITLIFDQRMHSVVRSALRGAEFLEEGDDFAAITVQSPPQIISTPGCISAFYNQLSRKRVNVEDTVSCHTDTIMVVKMADAGRAFEALNSLIAEEGKKTRAH